MNDVLKEVFSKLEHKLDYGDETELTDLEIASLLNYIGNLESNAKNLQQRIDKAINKIDLILKYSDPTDIYQFVDIQDKFIDIKTTLKGDNND